MRRLPCGVRAGADGLGARVAGFAGAWGFSDTDAGRVSRRPALVALSGEPFVAGFRSDTRAGVRGGVAGFLRAGAFAGVSRFAFSSFGCGFARAGARAGVTRFLSLPCPRARGAGLAGLVRSRVAGFRCGCRSADGDSVACGFPFRLDERKRPSLSRAGSLRLTLGNLTAERCINQPG